jgi:GntR family transcriptional regulator, vanillate catabolism transcriptional regulator
MSATIELADDSAALSQTVRTQLRLRELILGGELKPGARIAELSLVERLGASRTPIRMALVRLQEEGLLEALPNGGYAVKDFSENDIHDAIELRGTLEGLCARLAAERGVPGVLMAEARDCVERIDDLLAAPSLSEESFTGYVLHNGRLHDLLAEMAGSTWCAASWNGPRPCPSPLPTVSCWPVPPDPTRVTRWSSRRPSTARCSKPSSGAKARAPKA